MSTISRKHLLSGLALAVALGISGGSAVAAEKLKVAILVPGLANDGSFNQVALEGVKKLASEGLITFEIREKQKDPASSEPVIRQYAQRGYDLIIGHGIELSEPILTVAKDFPEVHFAASDGPILPANSPPTLMAGLMTSLNKAISPLGRWKKRRGQSGAVGGPQLPFILASHKGFKAGLAETDPSATVIEVFTGSFDDVLEGCRSDQGSDRPGRSIGVDIRRWHRNGVAAAADRPRSTRLALRQRRRAGEEGECRVHVEFDADDIHLLRQPSGAAGNAERVDLGLLGRGRNAVPDAIAGCPHQLSALADQILGRFGSLLHIIEGSGEDFDHGRGRIGLGKTGLKAFMRSQNKGKLRAADGTHFGRAGFSSDPTGEIALLSEVISPAISVGGEFAGKIRTARGSEVDLREILGHREYWL